jgi:hypothetical protein
MLLRFGFIVALAAVLAGGYARSQSVASDSGKSLAARLVGTWQLLDLVDTDTAGNVRYPYGKRPRGYIVYDPTGRLHVQVMRTPPTAPFAAGDQSGTDEEVRAAYDGYVAYFGTYEVDEARSQVIHRVEGSLMPGYTGTDQPRPIRLVGDELVIEGKTPEGNFYRRLRRVR